MPQYFSPGVFVEEVDSGPRPIQGVSTSVTGAIGVTQRGPTKGKPILVTSFNEFRRIFGGFLPDPEAGVKASWEDKTNLQGGVWWKFPNAISGFFDNGGQQLYVKRVVSGINPSDPAIASSALLKRAVISEILDDANKGATRLTTRHVLGLDTDQSKQVKIIDGQSSEVILDTSVIGYEIGATECTLELAMPLERDVLASRGDYLLIRPLDSGTDSLRIKANSEGRWGDDLHVRVRPIVGAALKVRHFETTADPPGSGKLAKISEVSNAGNRKITLATGHTLKAGDHVRINDHKYLLSGGTVVAGKNEIQSLSIVGGPPTTGNFELTFDGQTTADIAFNATAAVVQTALEALATIKSGNVTCSGGPLPATPIVIKFANALGEKDVSVISSANSGLDAGTPNITVTTEGSPPLSTEDFEAAQIGPKDKTQWIVGTSVQKLRKATSGGKTISVSGATRLYKEAMVELDTGAKKRFFIVKSIAGDVVELDHDPPADLVEGDQVLVIEAEVAARYAPGGEIVEDETFSNLKLVSDDPNDPLLITNFVKRRSNLIVADDLALSNASLAEFPGHGKSGYLKLGNGDDKYASLVPDDFIGKDGGSGNRSGIKSMEDIEDISLVIAPGMWARSIVNELTRHCEAMRYRMAILDAQLGATPTEVRAFRDQFDSKYAALYYPWLKSRQPGLVDDVVIPPSGHMAGIYADVDARRGVHKAPANEVIKSITEIHQDVTRREQDLLNPKGINALRFFPGRGNRVWGARTISSDSNFRYVNVRRIFNFIERSIDEGTQFVVFEPNDPLLWSRVRQTINNFLNTQWRAGMLEGRVAEEAYFVACDRGVTMTQNDIEDGKLICEIGIAPVFPAEFVIFRIQKFTADSKLA